MQGRGGARSTTLAAANRSGNALGLLPQAMALALAMERKAMPLTPASWDPRFSIGPRRTWLGGLPGNADVLRPFPTVWRVCGAPAGRCFSEVGRGSGRPQIGAGARAMMLTRVRNWQ